MKDYNVTSAGTSAEADRSRRIKIYFIMMVIRVICIVSLIWVRGWWILVAALGGIFLPYFAVLIANEPDRRQNKKFETINELVLEGKPGFKEENEVAPTVIVIDDPAPRRTSKDGQE